MIQKGQFLRYFIFSIVILVSLLLAGFAVPPSMTKQGQPVNQCENIEEFLDQTIPEEMSDSHLAGFVVSVVQADEVVSRKGYGYAQLDNLAADPNESLFQIGSVTKLFTWTAVMQLVEQGRLSLDSDIQTYLGDSIIIPERPDGAVMLSHLMTHSAGFEDHILGIYTQDINKVTRLEDFLSESIPARVRPAGEVISYSNYGTALAAHIVERVSGQSFPQYVTEYIFQPLGMENTYFQQDVPGDRTQFLAAGYTYRGGGYQPVQPAFTRQTGAGGLVSSAADMSRFMLAYLAGASGNDTGILQSQTVQQMFTGRFSGDERLPGVAHGFWEESLNGYRVLYHAGDTLHFSAMLALIPEADTGIFMVYNRLTAAPREQILNAFVDTCLPQNVTDPPTYQANASAGASISGYYRSTRLSYTTPARLSGFAQAFRVKTEEDGQLTFGGQRYQEVAPLLFQQIHGDEQLAFRQDDAGGISYMFIRSNPLMAYEKARWYETPAIEICSLAVPAAFFLLSALIGMLGVIRHRGKPSATGRAAVGWISVLLSLLAILTIAGAASAMLNAEGIIFGAPAGLQAAVVLANTFAAVSLVLVFMLVIVWIRRTWERSQRMHLLLLVGFSLLLVLALRYWNLVSW